MELYRRIVNKKLLVRRVTLSANHLIPETQAAGEWSPPDQLDLFGDGEARCRQREAEDQALDKEKRKQQAVLNLQKRFGKNTILKGTDFQEGATTVERNSQIGGHKA